MTGSRHRILVVDDEPDIRQLIGQILSDHDYLVTEVHDAVAARTAVRLEQFDAILLDIWMPGVDGITLLKEWRQASMDVPVVMMSAHGSIETAVEATQLGALDFLEKPFSSGRLTVTVRNAVASGGRAETVDTLNLEQQLKKTELIGASALIKALRNQIRESAENAANVMIIGEDGSGRKTAGRMIHDHRGGVERNLAVLDWLIDPTGGKSIDQFIESSAAGTILIPSLETYDGYSQSRILGLAQKIEVLKKTSSKRSPKIVTTATAEIYERLKDGQIRGDMYHRLSELIIEMPALRQHPQDIPELVGSMIDEFSQEDGLPYKRVTTAALNVLRNHHWSGNVRELKNVLRQAVLSSSSETVDGVDIETQIKHFDAVPTKRVPTAISNELEMVLPFREAREQFERRYLLHNLHNSHTYVEMAEKTGLHRSSLFRKLKDHGIDHSGDAKNMENKETK